MRTNRGGYKLFDENNYHYRLDYNRYEKTYWKCIQSGCNARAVTNKVDMEGEVEILNLSGQHPHSARPLENQVSMKNSAQTILGSSRKIISSSLLNVSNNVKAALPQNIYMQ